MTETSPKPQNSNSAEDRPAYELEPAPQPPTLATGSGSAPASPSSPASPKRGLLDGFKPDDDFEHDPEVARATTPTSKRSGSHLGNSDGIDPLVKRGFGNASVWGIIGGIILIAAVVAAAMNTPNPFASSLLVVYNGLVHVGTGLAALYVTARLLSRPFGAIDLASGRLLTTVAAFLLVFHLNITLAGQGKWEEVILASLAYLVIIAGLFRLWGRELGILVAAHFFLWLILELGMQLSVWAGSAAATRPLTP